MSTFLGIYSKQHSLDPKEIEPVLLDFSLNNKRSLLKKEYPGMIFCVASKFKNAYSETEHTFSLVSGHISFENINEISDKKSCSEKFDQFIQHSKLQDLNKLEGAFAAIHYNQKEHRLILTNDKFGVFPLFIFENNNYLIFSNEYQPLLSFQNQKEKDLDYNAIAEFFTLGTTLGDKTFFKSIRNLSPASYLIAKGEKTEQKKYWSTPIPSENQKGIQLITQEVFQLFTKLNREYLDAGLTDLCLLSAGADSRLILATLTDEQRKNTQFYTSNLSFLDTNEDKDVIGATVLAKELHLKHRVEKISFYENAFNSSYFDEGRELRDANIYGGWHGGEVLGAYCLNAAPIPRDLTFKEVDKKLRSLFSWRFRWKLTKHPYQSYLEEKKKHQPTSENFLFLIEQFFRGFFTNIYSGSRGYWLQPYQLTNHGLSPFWDSRFLSKIIQIPIEQLKDYKFYNTLFSLCEKRFTEIGFNSPITNAEGNTLPKINIGLEPKQQVPNVHHEAYLATLQDEKIWKRSFYNKKKFKSLIQNEFDPLAKQWLDFEVWYKRYVN